MADRLSDSVISTYESVVYTSLIGYDGILCYYKVCQ